MPAVLCPATVFLSPGNRHGGGDGSDGWYWRWGPVVMLVMVGTGGGDLPSRNFCRRQVHERMYLYIWEIKKVRQEKK